MLGKTELEGESVLGSYFDREEVCSWFQFQ